MAALLSGVTSDTVGTGAAQTGPCMIYLSGSLGGGLVRIEVSDTNSNFRTWDVRRDQSPVTVPNTGAYFIRAVLVNSSSPSLTVTSV